MLQRAASNAYSWWWASHIRTKQSKWLEQNLQDMEEKVQYMVKLIEEDGDSFAKRAEMYYKKRPELINFVEESYRAYRALAERFDHISKELQNANSALAAAFPDQYQFGIDDDDEYGSPRTAKRMPGGGQNLNVPKVPKFPAKNIKAIMALTKKKKTPIAGSHARGVPKSGLSKDQALDEIDKLQKVILTKQTEKEFTKSSYESGVQKYWQMEEEITEMQDKISKLQDEFGIGKVIEDDEARNLMAEAALKSCQDTLVQLQEKQEKTAVQAKAEHERIKNARDKLLSLRKEFHGDQKSSSQATSANEENSFMEDENWIPFDEPQETSSQVKQLEELRDKVKEEFKDDSGFTVTEMAEKIDKLVSKVINLETAVSSQTALIQRLRSETDGLQEQIKTLEDDKVNLIDGKNTLSDKLAAMENRLKGLQNLNNSFESQNNQLKSQFTKSQLNIEQLSEKLPSLKPDEETEVPQQARDSKIEVVVKEEKEQQTTTMPEAEDQTDKTAQVQKSAAKPDTDSSSHEIVVKEEKEQQTTTMPEAEDQTDKTAQVQKSAVKPDTDSSSHEIDSSKSASQDVKHPEVPHQPKDVPSTISIQPQVQSSQPEDEPATTTTQPLVEAGQTENKPAPLTTQTHVKANQKTDEPAIPGTQPQVEANEQTHAPATLGNTQPQEQASQPQEGDPNWQQMFMEGLEGKEKVLLAEYTSILRSYKEVKKKLGEIESQGQGDVSEATAHIRELKISNAKKDEEIQSLRQKLIALQRNLEGYKNEKEIEHTEADATSTERSLVKDDDLINAVKDLHIISPIEQKFREGIDEILEENLDFWMRFSTSFQQIQKFQNSFEDLQKELAKIEENNKQQQEGSSTAGTSLKSEARPIYKHMREIENELTVWVEHSQRLKEELQRRFTQLCNIQEEITHALNAGAEDDEMKFTSFQAAKFQGEVLNMQQENNKVADELQAGLDHITSLQVEVERTITRLNEELGFSGSRSQNSPMRSGSKARVPLRSFIFGVKPQKKKQSIFSCMHPGLNRKYHHLRTGDSL